jgi:hypothetical protein
MFGLIPAIPVVAIGAICGLISAVNIYGKTSSSFMTIVGILASVFSLAIVFIAMNFASR